MLALEPMQPQAAALVMVVDGVHVQHASTHAWRARHPWKGAVKTLRCTAALHASLKQTLDEHGRPDRCPCCARTRNEIELDRP